MARKGDIAKATVLNKISEIYPDAIFADKKLYVWETDEGGEKVQIAIAMTMPKVPVESGESMPKVSSGAAPWENAAAAASIIASKDEEEMVEKLLLKLGIKE